MDITRQIKRVKVLGPKILKELNIETSSGACDIVELLLELCDNNLLVDISEMEAVMLNSFVQDIRAAGPRMGLRELRQQDPAVDFFLGQSQAMLRQLNVDARVAAWYQACRVTLAAAREGRFPKTPWAKKIESLVGTAITTMCQLELAAARPKFWRN